jgi:WD40 repeat protein
MNSKKLIVIWIFALIVSPLFGQNGLEIFTIKDQHKSPIKDIVFNRDSSLMVSVSDSTVNIWRVSQSEPARIKTLRDKAFVNSVSFYNGDQILITAGESQSLNFWDWEKGEKIKTFKIRYTQSEVDAFVNKSEKNDAERRQWQSNSSSSNKKSSSSQKASENKFEKKEIGDFPSVIYKILVQGDNIYSAHADNTIKQWVATSETGKMETFRSSENEIHKWDINDICFSKDKKRIYSASDDNTIKIWDTYSTAYLKSFRNQHVRSVMRILLSPKGNLMASLGKDNTLRIWDLDGNQKCGTVSDKDVVDVAFSNSGNFIALAVENVVQLWSVNKEGKLALVGNTEVFMFSSIAKILFLPSKRESMSLLVCDENGEMKGIDVRVLIVRKYFEKDYDKRIKAEKELFADKGEFEKEDAYQRRLKTQEVFLEKLDREYLLRFGEINIEPKEDAVNDKKITLKIDKIDTYDADREVFPITIKGITKDVAVPFDDAPAFKKNASRISATGLERTIDKKKRIVEVKILDPNTKKEYPFGDLEEEKQQ